MSNARWNFRFALLVVSFLPLLVAATVQAAIPASERTVLLNLYAGTNGATWTTSTNWNGAAGTECTWYGITCDGAQTTVTGIILQTNNLSGTLPSDLSNLTNLFNLNVSDNHLTGSIPQLTGLTNLWGFNVGANQLTGSIPSLIGLTNLAVFQAYTNQLTGSIPALTGLVKLEAFVVENNQLTGSIPALAGLPQLSTFSVRFNSLTGAIPPLAGLPFLVVFDASFNQLTGAVPALAGLANLLSFYIQFNALSGSIPVLTGLSNLVFFNAGFNSLTGVIPPLSGSPGLVEFRVGSNQLTGAIPALGSLTGMTSFDVSSNALTGPIPSLAGLTNLYLFDASFNHLSGPAPALTGLTSLAIFRIGLNQLSGIVPTVPMPSVLLASASMLCPNGLNQTPDPAWDAATGQAPWYTACGLPVVVSAVSRKVHGAAGTFDLPLSSVTTSPSTEPRLGPTHTIVVTFNGPPTAATASVTEGLASAGAPTFNGNDLQVDLTGVTDGQYVTVSLANVLTSGGVGSGSGSVRVGFLVGDVNQNRVVTVADLGLVNAQLAQVVTPANFLKDVNATGTLTVADKGITNANLARALPAP